MADGTRLRIPGLGLQDQGDLFLTVRIDRPKGPRVVKAEVVGPAAPSTPSSADEGLDGLMAAAAAPDQPLPSGIRREGAFLIQEPASASPGATTPTAPEAAPVPPTSTHAPVAEDGAWLTPVLWLVWLACLGLVIWGNDLSIIRGLDRERPDDVIVEVGVPKTITVGTPQQSVKGYYRMDAVTASFTADGQTMSHPIDVTDVGGRKWGEVIQYKEHVMKDAVVEPNNPIAIAVKLTIPPELAQQAKGGRIDFAFTITFPWLVSEGDQRSFEEKTWSVDHQITLTLREAGAPLPSMTFRYIVLALLIGLFPFGIVRANAGAKAQVITAVILTVLAIIGYVMVQMKIRTQGHNPSQSTRISPKPQSTGVETEKASDSSIRTPTPDKAPVTSIPETPAPPAGPPFPPQTGPSQIRLHLAHNLTLYRVEPGTFSMGSLNGDLDERPVTTVTITRPFLLATTETTQAQWVDLMKSNPSLVHGQDLPVEQITWQEAMVFCQRLTEREKTFGRIPAGSHFTLPTEAQWEFACRAGTTTPFSGDIEAMIWSNRNSRGQPQPAGRKQPNAWGFHDMHGNVREMCLDYIKEYPGGTVQDIRGVTDGSIYGVRGGNFRSQPFFSSARTRGYAAAKRDPGIGFRVALVLD